MVSTKESIRMLMTIQEGKISTVEGARLIETLDDLSKTTLPSTLPSSNPADRKPRYLSVLIKEISGEARVNVRLLDSLIISRIRVESRFASEIEGLDTEDLNASLNSSEVG